MENKLSFLAMMLLVFFASCTKVENPSSKSEQINIPSASINPSVSSEGGDTRISFTTTAAWTASVILTKSESWVDVNPKSGSSGNAEIVITTMANKTNVERQATIQIKSGFDTKEIVLTQAAMTVDMPVDLGLSVKWATCNLGASRPEEPGDYYAWGEIEPYYDGDPLNPSWKDGIVKGYWWTSYKWCNGSRPDPNNTDGKITKYNILPEYGAVDNKMMLELEDDAAHVKLGGDWRIPTEDEIEELLDNCNCYIETVNNVTGIKFTSKVAGFTNSSIFIPSSNYYYLKEIQNENIEGESKIYYRSSTLFHGDPSTAGYGSVSVYSRSIFLSYISHIYSRVYGIPIRPVFGKVIDVSSFSLDKSEISLEWGESESLTTTIIPPDATNKSISWQTDDSSIAAVDANGKITACGEGKATITAYASNGRLLASCTVTVTGMPSFDSFVDLGLSVKWATCNLGASRPEEPGDYYAWGEIEPYYDGDPLNPSWKDGKDGGYDWPSYKWCNGKNPASGNNEGGIITKYNTNPEYGVVDNKLVLEMEDDAAHVVLGGKWRMPTLAETEELVKNCNWEWVTLFGVRGYKVSGKKAGFTDQWIFLPAAGYIPHHQIEDLNERGNYWSSSLYDLPDRSYTFDFAADGYFSGVSHSFRHNGLPVRPVSD